VSDSDIAKVRAFYTAAERNDVDQVLELLHPDVSWEAPAPLPYGGLHHGHEGWREYRKGIQENFEPGYKFHIEHTFHCDGQVVVLGHLEGKAKKTGLPLDSPFGHIWTLNDKGRVVARHYHVDTRALLSAFTGENGSDEDGQALEVVMGVYDATRRGDREAVAARLAPDVDWKIPSELPYGGEFKGAEGVMKSRSIANEHFVPGQKFTPNDVFRSADRIVGIGTMEAVVAATEQPLTVPFMHVWKVEGDKVVARRQYTDTGTILHALLD
jgi:ketosteroid isomerase-like protein